MKKKKEIELIDDLIDISDIENIEEIKRENVESVSKELGQVTCPKCGYKNFELIKKCIKCHYDFEVLGKSCPKCGKITANSVKKCECGFNFKKKKRPLIINLILTALIMAVFIILTGKYGNLIEKYDMVIKVFAIYIAYVILCKMFIYSGTNELFGAEHEMLEHHKRKVNPRLKRNLFIIFGFIVAIGFLVYYYYFK